MGMRNIIRLFIYFIVVIISTVSCRHRVSNETTLHQDSIFRKEELQYIDTVSKVQKSREEGMDNTINENSTLLYLTIDSLLKDTTVLALKKLDSICSHIDGDLAEKYYEATQILIDHRISQFLEYLYAYPSSCLKTQLIKGISADLSVYQGEERDSKLTQVKRKILENAVTNKIAEDRMKLLNEILDGIDPEMFD